MAKTKKTTRSRSAKRLSLRDRMQTTARPGGKGRPYPLEIRRAAVEEVLNGTEIDDVVRAFGMGRTTLCNWVALYRAGGGVTALIPKPRPPRSPPSRPASVVEAVVAERTANPHHGTRRIEHLLARFEGIGVSEHIVRRILHEEGLLTAASPVHERPAPAPHRFERAQPNQLWQSDIFSFLLRRHERIYLTAFMDDHSRFIVGHAIAHQQRGTLVLEAVERGIAAFGTPQEILTDNGRQYTAWRGETVFEQELRRQGIRHIKSKPHHPQTLGKIERFWKTLWDEFLSRTVFADYADCERRLALFVHAYNFERPHQALAGLVPADRFFRAAPQVREAIERSVAGNALRLAMQQPTRKPFYIAGRLGDRDLLISAEGDGLKVRVGDQEPQTIALEKETPNDPQEALREEAVHALYESPSAVSDAGRADAPATRPARPHDASVARAEQPRRERDRAPSVADAPERAIGRDPGDDGDRTRADLPTDVLSLGDARTAGGARRDGADGAGSGLRSSGDAGAADRVARAATGPERAKLPEGRADALTHTAGDPYGAGDNGPQGAPADEGVEPDELDEVWEQLFEALEDGPDYERRNDRGPFDPEREFRRDAMTWCRKLAGDRAPADDAIGLVYAREVANGAREQEVHAGTSGARGGRRAGEERAGGALGDNLDERGGATARHVTQSLPDDRTQRARGTGGECDPADGGSARNRTRGEGAEGADRATRTRERIAEAASGELRSPLDGGRRRTAWPYPDLASTHGEDEGADAVDADRSEERGR